MFVQEGRWYNCNRLEVGCFGTKLHLRKACFPANFLQRLIRNEAHC